ncbi:hypothetical protein Clacol_004917 [Clathrus columnatus]|uniref:Inosine/uridine-preferring nucleoside hydrolase domain-containing protein n=1 Tax=Clathrus columnatus TaxID=1419009 RepID=A0AAV5AFG7_9AGAM|nr:hypothetical protein Clacol_004917 [Clathrus columnatus]
MSFPSLVALLLVGLTTSYALPTPPLTYTDDAGAIAIANTLQTMGYVNILGIVSDVTSNYSLAAIDAINTWYCHPNIPLAQTNHLTDTVREPEVNSTDAEYITTLANSQVFPQNFDRSKVKDPVEFYHDILSEAEDNSVTIIAIGFFTNLYNLYYSENGPALIKAKVKELVVQGGSCNTTDKPHNAGYNQVHDLPSAEVVMKWPSPVTFFPGFVANQVQAGQAALNISTTNPVRFVYETVDFGLEFEPDDIITTYYAIFGLTDDSFIYGNSNGTGGLQFVPNPKSPVAVNKYSVWNYVVNPPAQQRYVILNKPPQTIADKLNGLISCFGEGQPNCSS